MLEENWNKSVLEYIEYIPNIKLKIKELKIKTWDIVKVLNYYNHLG